MMEHGGWQFPDGEQHLVEMLDKVNRPVGGRLSYQYSKLEMALGFVKRWRRAVDVGAHVGLWSHYLAPKFAEVDAFEPMPAHRECFAANVTAGNVTLHPVALGAAPGQARLTTCAGNSGHTHVAELGEIVAPMVTLDSFGFGDVDFLKIDCEGYELAVLRGAVETLERCKPVIIVEQKYDFAERYGYGARAAIPFLEAMGAEKVAHKSGDFVMAWKERY